MRKEALIKSISNRKKKIKIHALEKPPVFSPGYSYQREDF
jgi:hypothetical protein